MSHSVLPFELQVSSLLLTNHKISDKSRMRFKSFAENKLNEDKKSKFVFGRAEKIVGKEENADYQHFLTMF